MTKTTGSIAASTNIVKESVVMGDVSIGEDSTILFYAVLRGDDNKIIIGKGTNIQDNCTVHTSKVDPTMVGDYVTVGHNAILHGCNINRHGRNGDERQCDRKKLSHRSRKPCARTSEYPGWKHGYGQTGEGHAGIDGRRNCRVKRECTFLYRRGKETQGRRLLSVKKRYTSG